MLTIGLQFEPSARALKIVCAPGAAGGKRGGKTDLAAWIDNKEQRGAYTHRLRPPPVTRKTKPPADGMDLASREEAAEVALAGNVPRDIDEGLAAYMEAENVVTKKHLRVALAKVLFERPFFLTSEEKICAASSIKRSLYAVMNLRYKTMVDHPFGFKASYTGAIASMMKAFTDRLEMRFRPERQTQALVRQPLRPIVEEDENDD